MRKNDYSIEDFKIAVLAGALTDSDGHGSLLDDKGNPCMRIEASDATDSLFDWPEWAVAVRWFNK